MEVPTTASGDAGPLQTEFVYATEVLTALVCNKWKPVILWHLVEAGPVRNGELRRRIPRISQKVLTQQLREMEQHGLLARQASGAYPLKVEYSLTPEGLELWTLVEGLSRWGVRWAYRRGASIEAYERFEAGLPPG